MNPTPLGYYRWYPRDFISSAAVAMMSVTARGVYRALLDRQWEDGEIPTDPNLARRSIGAREDEWSEWIEFHDTCFPECPDGSRRNPVLAEQRDKSLGQIETSRKASLSRWQESKSAPEKKLRQAPQTWRDQAETLWAALPETHQTAEMRVAVDAYFEMRANERMKKTSAKTLELRAKQFAAHPATAVAKALAESASNAWQGVFPEKHHDASKAKPMEAEMSSQDAEDCSRG